MKSLTYAIAIKPVEPLILGIDFQAACNANYKKKENLTKSYWMKFAENMAMEYLRKQNLNKTEIAYLLGFSEVSAFSRTFKRWTGKSPSTFQKAIALPE